MAGRIQRIIPANNAFDFAVGLMIRVYILLLAGGWCWHTPPEKYAVNKLLWCAVFCEWMLFAVVSVAYCMYQPQRTEQNRHRFADGIFRCEQNRHRFANDIFKCEQNRRRFADDIFKCEQNRHHFADDIFKCELNRHRFAHDIFKCEQNRHRFADISKCILSKEKSCSSVKMSPNVSLSVQSTKSLHWSRKWLNAGHTGNKSLLNLPLFIDTTISELVHHGFLKWLVAYWVTH